MLVKTVKYTDLNENEVTQDFYFAFTKLELLETELELGGVEDTIKRLTETQNIKEAYKIFKSLILAAYGEKSADGRLFLKEDDNGRPLSKKLESSPALSEIILEFLEDPESGAKFMQGCLPQKLVQETENARKVLQEAEQATEPAVAPEAPKEKTWDQYTRQELLDMPHDDFVKLSGTNANDMPHDLLVIAMQRRNQQQ